MPGRRSRRQPPAVEQYRREAADIRHEAALVRAARVCRPDDTIDQLASAIADDVRVTATTRALTRSRTENGFTAKLRTLFEGGQHVHG